MDKSRDEVVDYDGDIADEGDADKDDCGNSGTSPLDNKNDHAGDE